MHLSAPTRSALQALTAVTALFTAPACFATVINFDNLTGPVAITNQYASQGVLFSGIEATSQFATSVVTVSSPNYATPFYSDFTPGTLTFVDPSDSTIAAYVTSVSITLNGYENVGGWFDGATINALDPSNNVIAGQTQTIQPTNGTSYLSTTITFTGPIHALEFDNIPNDGRLGILPFDDLTFGSLTDTPEPATWLMGLIGLGLMVRRTRELGRH